MFQEYLGGEDWRINENSNMNYSLQGLNNHIISCRDLQVLAGKSLS